jgi:glucose-6-phosphate 1-epimerase
LGRLQAGGKLRLRMRNVNSIDPWRRFEIPGRVTLLEGNGEFPKLEVKTDKSSAEIYLHGAHVTDFQLNGEPSLLFLSQCSRFADGQPIRGGVPVIFPWFGAREGEPMHGFARLADWRLHETTALPEGGVTLRFSLPDVDAAGMWSAFTANYVVTVTEKLSLELIITNCSRDEQFTFENCLHTYFRVGDVSEISIHGLQGATYLDKVEGYAQRTEAANEIRISSEVDRIYLNTDATVAIVDPSLRRKIIIEKCCSKSTIVWNPWISRSQQIPDFGNDEYREMVCVESGNVSQNSLTLAPGRSAVLKVTLSSVPL